MHDTALKIGGIFFERYWKADYSTIVELGSCDVNGTLRRFQPAGSQWIGLDIEPGHSVDVCIQPGAALPIRSEAADIVLASSVFEHDEAFWATFQELCRITRPGGVVYINAPSNGGFHRYPQDCWRFYPDSSRSLEKWARSSGMDVTLIESFVANRDRDAWNDFVAIFGKGPVGARNAADLVHSRVPCRNIHRIGEASVLRYSNATEDMDLIRDQASVIVQLKEAEALDLVEKNLLETSLRRDREASSWAGGRAMPRLFTAHGTVLFVDPASGDLRHGPVERSPENAFFVSGEGSGRIVHAVDGALQPTVCGPGRCHVGEHGAGGATERSTTFERIAVRHNWLGLRAAGLFLCAEPDGRITLSREVCRAWESFLPFASPAGRAETIEQPDPKRPALADGGHRSTAVLAASEARIRRPAEGIVAGGRIGRFARRRVIIVRHRGNLANKMLQYMGALTLAKRIKDCSIVNVSIPEWGIDIPDDTQGELFFDNVDLGTWDPFRPHVEELCEIANRSQSIRIVMADHLQRMEFLTYPQYYNAAFPRRAQSSPLSDGDLLINIRAAEILQGVPHYPLLPIAFYEDVVARTGLDPVFVGQLTPSRYVHELRQRFAGARFIDSQGARTDFDIIRSAKNIVVAVSTFSWLAAWLSEADTIVVPLAGFYNPAHHREVDLLPVDDIRYRYFLFPLTYGVPEEKALQHHQRMAGRWKEVSRNQVALLKSATPFLRVPRENYYSGLPSGQARGSLITFDPVWYAHEYVDAAMEISEGWFEDPLHHYLEVGRLRGHLPVPPLPAEAPLDPSLPNLALGKSATQSSLSEWSRGATVEADASNAVNGNPSKDYGFHTGRDPQPWWLVDLEAPSRVHFIRIFNRDFVPDWVQRRASPLVIEASRDGDQWTLLLRTAPGQLFGGYSGGAALVWISKHPVEARYIRVSIPRSEFLHLAEVEVYGTVVPQPARRG